VNIDIESKKTLERLLLDMDLSDMSKADAKLFTSRIEVNFPQLFAQLHHVYSEHYDFYYFLQQLLKIMQASFKKRKPTLKKKDKQRLSTPDWFKDEKMLGMACYVDLFAGDLQHLHKKIPYLSSLGITYLHLMPLYKSPEGDSDGGYAVSDYREVDTKLGTMTDLESLGEALSKAGINLVLDFVFNHTSDQHDWAMLAKQGEEEFQEYYWMFDNKDIPNQYEQSLREIFPQVRRGNFTWNKQTQKWVWTTFNSFQWDLNYSNPAVFNAIADEMLFLANVGCDALRLDALAFIWKEMGTDCENQPKAHALIKAFNCCLKIVSPSVVFKSEAIVHPDEVAKYIHEDECELSYNPLLMALIWNSVATRKTKLLTKSMQKSFAISPDCAWVNYARCHDDIGWTFDDNVAAQIGINSYDHRHFLNQFFTGRFEGSFAKGVAFAENPATGDCRVCGSLASLSGLEQGIELNDLLLIENAVKRVLLIHSVILAIGGVPLLYSGDELGLLNDYSYQVDPSKAHDERWVHRIAVTDSDVLLSRDKTTPFFEIAKGLENMIKVRQQNAIFGAARTDILDAGNEHIFSFSRTGNRMPEDKSELLVLCNFSEQTQSLNLASMKSTSGTFFATSATDLLTQTKYPDIPDSIDLGPLEVKWLLLKN
jgi:amylosucrase